MYFFFCYSSEIEGAMKRRMWWMTATVVRTACSDLKDWRSKTMVVWAKTKGVMVRTVVVVIDKNDGGGDR